MRGFPVASRSFVLPPRLISTARLGGLCSHKHFRSQSRRRERIKNERSATGVTDEIVLNQPLMQALLGKIVDGKKTGDGQNVLDLLYELLLDSGRGNILDPLLGIW